MMKLLLAVIATCALVVSPTCIKIKHQLRSNAPTIHVLISNGNTQMTSQVARDDSHRFITDNLSNMTLAPAGTQTVTLSYDEIFPLTDAAVCTEVHPVSAGGCADGVCCKVSISMYTITDAIIMTSRVNNRKADGNPQFWKCEQEFQVPGVTNTEPTGEEIAAEILHGEAAGEIDGSCNDDNDCGTNAECLKMTAKCKCKGGFKQVDGNNRNCENKDECTDDDATCKQVVDGVDTDNTCADNTPSDTDPEYYTCSCDDTDYFADTTSEGLATCTECADCATNTEYCKAYSDNSGTCCKVCAAKMAAGQGPCTSDIQCLGDLRCDRSNTRTCVNPV